MYHLKVTIFDKTMAVGKSENLVIRHIYKLEQPSDKGIHCSALILMVIWRPF